jgi:Inactive homolog of metal-dependent proteases, putative molecular chaperone
MTEEHPHCLLAIETSSELASIALLRGRQVLAQDSTQAGPGLSAWLLPAIDALLAHHGGRSGVQALACGIGPGAFTGVRTACATAQALAWAWRLPLVAVDSLEALAATVMLCTEVVGEGMTAIDARMKEVYMARWALPAGARQATPALLLATRPERVSATALLAEAEWNHSLAEHDLGWLAGSAAPVNHEQGRRLPVLAWPELQVNWALGVAAVAQHRLLAGQTIDPLQLAPLYVRNTVALTEVERRAVLKA